MLFKGCFLRDFLRDEFFYLTLSLPYESDMDGVVYMVANNINLCDCE